MELLDVWLDSSSHHRLLELKSQDSSQSEMVVKLDHNFIRLELPDFKETRGHVQHYLARTPNEARIYEVDDIRSNKIPLRNSFVTSM